MRRFYRFCDAYDISAPFPVSESTLCYFVTVLANDNLAAQTIKTYLAAVRDTHIALGFPDPRAHSAMSRLDRIQAGICRVLASRGKKKTTRLPVTPAILERMRRHWASSGDRNGQLYWAVSTICYFGFFRLGELLLPTEAETRALLKWGDITFNHASQPTLLKVHLHVAKCDQFGEGTDVFMGRTGNTICPIDACLAYVAVRGDSPGPFFMTQESKPLLKPSFVFEVRKALSAVGLPAGDYAGHSFRIGAATAAAAAGIEDSTIQLLGRWNSAAFLSYVRTPRQKLASASTLISRID